MERETSQVANELIKRLNNHLNDDNIGNPFFPEQGVRPFPLTIAMNNLGALYERGLGVTKDQKKAEYWYAKAREALESKQFLESPATEIN
jgi:Sel1 repeat